MASVDVIDASKITTEKVESYDILLLGTSTWGDGELQDDWYDAIKMIRTADLNGKIVALFGCGGTINYTHFFHTANHLICLLQSKRFERDSEIPRNSDFNKVQETRLSF